MAALNIPSLNYRLSPLAPLTSLSTEELSLRPLWDLGHAPEATVTHPENHCGSFEKFTSCLKERLTAFQALECPGICLTLPNRYRFIRNSKKQEINNIYLALKDGKKVSDEELWAWQTALAVHVATLAHQENLPVILNTEASEEELIALYDYLALNRAVPETLFRSATPYRRFTVRFAFRTEKGLPGIVPLSDNPETLSQWFPIGHSILFSETPRDNVELTEVYQHRRNLAVFLETVEEWDSLDSLTEDIVYINTLNRFGM